MTPHKHKTTSKTWISQKKIRRRLNTSVDAPMGKGPHWWTLEAGQGNLGKHKTGVTCSPSAGQVG